MLGLRLRRVDEVDPENRWTRYVFTAHDQYTSTSGTPNTWRVIRWWHPGLWWLIWRDEDLKGKRWQTYRQCYDNRLVFVQ